ncbi:hypothetical protein TSOC_009561 [Tetrabaena socialis]|uniref:Uncharacterized protein n=1 Tax=Tetrabaena socialis TaxID=47790 RepID=A0A2J7ZVJ3_9CHLO|nr:hypothetical protein TSOC_009561 [Tetrabaena socialis]|eukprot:PNH04297.1 hypothetical protein TSOC_009561 [Tetrabaena socialis]
MSAVSAASPAAGTGLPRGTPAAARLLTFFNSSPYPTPTSHSANDQSLNVLEKKWRQMYAGIQGNSQAAAEVLVKQAAATSQLEEMVQHLFTQLKAGVEDRVRLQQVLLQERAQALAHAEEAQQLHQRLHTSEHRSTAVHVVTESLQAQLSQAAEQVKQLTEQLTITSECRTRGDALITEQAMVIDTLRQQLQEQADAVGALSEDKAHLEAQLQGVLRAEQELTGHLRETHAAIEGQLTSLRDQLKTERQKRAAVVKRRGELQAQVEALQNQMASQQAEMATLADKLARAVNYEAK